MTFEDDMGARIKEKQAMFNVADISERLKQKRDEAMDHAARALAIKQLLEQPGWRMLIDMIQQQQIEHATMRDDPSIAVAGFSMQYEKKHVVGPEGLAVESLTTVPVAMDGMMFAIRQATITGYINGLNLLLELPEMLTQAYSAPEHGEDGPAGPPPREGVSLDPVGGMRNA